MLRELKLIAEPWDIGPGGYQLGAFPGRLGRVERPLSRRRAPLLARRRRPCRRSSRRASPARPTFSARSAAARRSVNFIVAHDGFTLADLVSHAHKHNEANGEDNRDGTDANYSWNNGVEGPTDDPAIVAARRRDCATCSPRCCCRAARRCWPWATSPAAARAATTTPMPRTTKFPGWIGSARFLARRIHGEVGRPAAHNPALRQDRFLTGEYVSPGRARPMSSGERPDGRPMEEGDWHAGGAGTLIAALCADACRWRREPRRRRVPCRPRSRWPSCSPGRVRATLGGLPWTARADAPLRRPSRRDDTLPCRRAASCCSSRRSIRHGAPAPRTREPARASRPPCSTAWLVRRDRAGLAWTRPALLPRPRCHEGRLAGRHGRSRVRYDRCPRGAGALRRRARPSRLALRCAAFETRRSHWRSVRAGLPALATSTPRRRARAGPRPGRKADPGRPLSFTVEFTGRETRSAWTGGRSEPRRPFHPFRPGATRFGLRPIRTRFATSRSPRAAVTSRPRWQAADAVRRAGHSLSVRREGDHGIGDFTTLGDLAAGSRPHGSRDAGHQPAPRALLQAIASARARTIPPTGLFPRPHLSRHRPAQATRPTGVLRQKPAAIAR